jgi:isochorismate hydrolase
VRRVVLAGVNTHACVRTTAIDAYQRDLDVAIALDCTASYDEEHHDVTLRYCSRTIATVAPAAVLLPLEDGGEPPARGSGHSPTVG